MSFVKYPLLVADVPPAAGYTQNFRYYVKITNIKKYPNYLLFAQLTSPTATATPYVQI